MPLALAKRLLRSLAVGDFIVKHDYPIAAGRVGKYLKPRLQRSVLVFEALVCPRAGDLIEAFMPERVDERENLAYLPALGVGDGNAEQPLERWVQLQV